MGRLGFSFWQKWLLFALALQALAGITLAFFGPQLLFGSYYDYYLDALWGQTSIPENASRLHDWFYGVLGATIASWAVALALVTHHAFKRRELWAWNCIAISLGVWFPVDTCLSLFHGLWPNALFNLAALLMLAVPLAFSRKYFRSVS